MDYVKIPLSRVGVIIGPKGETKKRIEELSGCEIDIDSEEGIIEIKSKNEKDPLKSLHLHLIILTYYLCISYSKVFLLVRELTAFFL